MTQHLHNRINRAISDYRRGRPVLFRGQEGVVLGLAAELAGDEMLAGCEELTAGPLQLALTASRAAALNIMPSGHDLVLLDIPSWLDSRALSHLADATSDLAEPLRGPFSREKRAPLEAELAAVQLAKHARLLPAALVGRLPVETDLAALAEAHDFLLLEAADVAAFEDDSAAHLRLVSAARVPLADAEASRMIAFRPQDGGVEHIAIVIGDPKPSEPVLIRLHSECFTGDLLASMKCDCGEQLRGAVREISAAGGGVLLYLAQEGRGIGLINKLRAYRLQQDGFDTVDANLRLGFDADERVFRPAAEMLRALGFEKVRLLTNNPDKVAGLEACGIQVTDRVAHQFPANQHNELYLDTKKRRSGHLLS